MKGLQILQFVLITGLWLTPSCKCDNVPSSEDIQRRNQGLPTEDELKDLIISEKPLLTIGYYIDHNKAIATGGNKFKKISGNFCYVLNNKKKIGLSILKMRIYTINYNGLEKVVMENDIPISPSHIVFSNEIPLHSFYEMLGSGKYRLEFIKKEEVIATQTFDLE